MVVRCSWWVLRRAVRYPGEDAVLFTERPVAFGGGGGYGVLVARFRAGACGGRVDRSLVDLRAGLVARGYDLDALDRDNPFNGWMR